MATFTQADLVAIDKAIANSAKKVKFEDREVEYRSMEEMLQARKVIARSLGKGPKNALAKRHTFSFKKAIE